MRTWRWLSGLLLVLLCSSIAVAQPLQVTKDDTVIEPPNPPDLGQIQISQSVFDSLTKGTDKSAGAIQRSQLESKMHLYLGKVAADCELTDEQRAKLSIAIRADSCRLVSNYASVHSKYVNKTVSREIYTAAYADIIQSVTIPFAHPCGNQSLFFKVLRRQATPAQWQKFAEIYEAERYEQVRSVLTDINAGAISLSQNQLDKLTLLCLDKYPRWQPLPRTNTYARYVTMLVLSELSEEVQTHVTADQWAILDKNLATARRVEPSLRTLGVWPLPEENE